MIIISVLIVVILIGVIWLNTSPEFGGPIERVTIKAKELKIPIITPEIGEYVSLYDSNFVSSKWWFK